MKFKLIKELPFEQSPKIGYISKSDEIQTDGSHYWNGLWFNPENYPEFWQPVVEKDYEILTYIHNGSKHIWKKDSQLKNRFCLENGKSPFTRLEDILKYPKIYLIHSVKRLSDSEIFTIGDIVGTSDNTYPIVEFKICNNENTILVSSYFILYKSGYYNTRLKNVIKVKRPLFTTEDGVDIFKGNKVYYVETDDEPENSFKVNEYTVQYSGRFTSDSSLHSFSTKEKAEEYILMNKPVLSLKDVASIYISADKPITDTTSYSAQNRKIQDLVKSKIQQSV